MSGRVPALRACRKRRQRRAGLSSSLPLAAPARAGGPLSARPPRRRFTNTAFSAPPNPPEQEDRRRARPRDHPQGHGAAADDQREEVSGAGGVRVARQLGARPFRRPRLARQAAARPPTPHAPGPTAPLMLATPPPPIVRATPQGAGPPQAHRGRGLGPLRPHQRDQQAVSAPARRRAHCAERTHPAVPRHHVAVGQAGGCSCTSHSKPPPPLPTQPNPNSNRPAMKQAGPRAHRPPQPEGVRGAGPAHRQLESTQRHAAAAAAREGRRRPPRPPWRGGARNSFCGGSGDRSPPARALLVSLFAHADCTGLAPYRLAPYRNGHRRRVFLPAAVVTPRRHAAARGWRGLRRFGGCARGSTARVEAGGVPSRHSTKVLCLPDIELYAFTSSSAGHADRAETA